MSRDNRAFSFSNTSASHTLQPLTLQTLTHFSVSPMLPPWYRTGKIGGNVSVVETWCIWEEPWWCHTAHYGVSDMLLIDTRLITYWLLSPILIKCCTALKEDAVENRTDLYTVWITVTHPPLIQRHFFCLNLMPGLLF